MKLQSVALIFAGVPLLAVAVRMEFSQVTQTNETTYPNLARSPEYVADPPKSRSSVFSGVQVKTAGCGAKLEMPLARDYGWHLKDISTSNFKLVRKDNGQFVAMLGHSLLRGITPEMILWWWKCMANLRVKLKNVPGYQNKIVPAYYLWHPHDHICVSMKNPDKAGHAQIGSTLSVAEALNFPVYGYKYLVDSSVTIHNISKHGLMVGQDIPSFGPAGRSRIFLKPVEGGTLYHYENAIGLDENKGIGRFAKRMVNRKVKAIWSPEQFVVWHTHNVVEVGAFENFLPALYAQRADAEAGKTIIYDAETMNAAANFPREQTPFDPNLVARRVEDYTKADDLVQLAMASPDL